LAENLPARGAFKEFYLRLTGIVRQYIEGTTGIRAPEQTTEEFLRDVRSSNTFPVCARRGSRNFFKPPTWSSTPASNRAKVRSTRPSCGHGSLWNQVEIRSMWPREFPGTPSSPSPQ
jgi:hypothetical protein